MVRGGELVADRFVVEALAGAGGMGRVYRAHDRQTGERVALKLLVGDAGTHAARFAHEAQALAELSHPHIVRYVAHGVTAAGEPYLAMEWLEGEDLTSRLDRGGLPVEACVELGSRLADALGAAHARGIVHRDLKPGNVFLVGGRLETVKIIDFGLVWLAHRTHVTRTGVLVGTPGYMAPEQAQGGGVIIDARADVFSLGCLLFECLTGTPAFAGGHMMAVLAKVLFAEPPRVCELRPEASVALEQLVARMLAKDPRARPRDGAAVRKALAEVDAQTSGASRPPAALTRGERRTISVVLLEGRPEDAHEEGLGETAETSELVRASAVAELRRGAEALGGRLEPLHDGSLVVSIGGAGLATDRAAQAARCALWLRRHADGRALALATGRDEATGTLAAAEAIDRAAALLARAREAGDPTGEPAVAIDEMTAGLLDGRFDVREGDAGPRLHGERELGQGARLLLNKPTTCVGRDGELAMLTELFAACVHESEAQAVVVTGPAGIGKSRLLQELLTRVRERGDPPAVWIGRGDTLRAGASLSLLGQAIRGACGIRGDEPLAERRDKLAARVQPLFEASEQRRITELLGEIAGTGLPGHDGELLRAVRSNPQLMTDELRRAFIDFLHAACKERPVLLVLESLHWGDRPTVRFIDAALRELAEQPWMVLALARPEVHELFPGLWAERRTQELVLRQLSRRASERLVRQVLGSELDPAQLERIVAHADGNAFYLEELVRAAAEGRADALPETVVAMVQSRLEALDDEDRRALRAAAVFGETFWPRGVAALLGCEDRPGLVERRLLDLVEREVLVRSSESRFAGDVELSFRNVLLREGAYAMLTEDDRALGHRLAGEWLERAGEQASKLLAVHFDRGGEGARAATHYLRAAEHALEAGDHEGVLALCERGSAVAHDPEVLAGLRASEAEARLYRGELQRGLAASAVALALAGRGSRNEYRARFSGVLIANYLRDFEALGRWTNGLLETEPQPAAGTPFAAACFSVITSHLGRAQRDAAELHLRRLQDVTAAVMGSEPLTAAWVELSRSMWSLHVERDFWGLLEHSQRAIEHYRRSGITGMLPFMRYRIASSYAYLGRFEEAEPEFVRAYATMPPGGTDAMNAGAAQVYMWIEQGRLDEASALAGSISREASLRGDGYLKWAGRMYVIEAGLRRGTVELAETEEAALYEVTAKEPYLGLWFLTVLASVRLVQGRAEEAVALAERAFARARACGMGYCIRHADLLLVRAEAFHAVGDRAAARRALRRAVDDLMSRAARIPDAEVRRRFLENILAHRRTLELARQWLGRTAVAGAGVELGEG